MKPPLLSARRRSASCWVSDGPGLAAGSFVWTMFPFGPPDPTDLPGPVRHVDYILGRNGAGSAIVAYSSSGPWQGDPPPLGIIQFDRAAAEVLGQRPFHLDLRCLALMPCTRAWLPELGRPGHGVLGVAGVRLRSRIQTVLDSLVLRSPRVIQLRGPC